METLLSSAASDSVPTPKISTASLGNATATATLPRLVLWDKSVEGSLGRPPPHFSIYEWLGDACLNFAGFYFPTLPIHEAKFFSQFFKKATAHKILVHRCYIDKDKQSMGERIKSNVPNIVEKVYSDYLEFYIGIMLKSPGLDGDEVWDTVKRIVTVGLIYHLNKDGT